MLPSVLTGTFWSCCSHTAGPPCSPIMYSPLCGNLEMETVDRRSLRWAQLCLLAVASFPSSANAWLSRINQVVGVVVPFNRGGGKKIRPAASLTLLPGFWMRQKKTCQASKSRCSVELVTSRAFEARCALLCHTWCNAAGKVEKLNPVCLLKFSWTNNRSVPVYR